MWPFNRKKTETITIKRPGREEETLTVLGKDQFQFVRIHDAFGNELEEDVSYLFKLGVVKSYSNGVMPHPVAERKSETGSESPAENPSTNRLQETLRLLSRAVTDISRFAMQDGHGLVEEACSDAAFKILGLHAEAEKIVDADKVAMDIYEFLIAAAVPFNGNLDYAASVPLNGNRDYTDTVASTFARMFVRHMPETNWAEIARQHVKDATTDMTRQFGSP